MFCKVKQLKVQSPVTIQLHHETSATFSFLLRPLSQAQGRIRPPGRSQWMTWRETPVTGSVKHMEGCWECGPGRASKVDRDKVSGVAERPRRTVVMKTLCPRPVWPRAPQSGALTPPVSRNPPHPPCSTLQLQAASFWTVGPSASLLFCSFFFLPFSFPKAWQLELPNLGIFKISLEISLSLSLSKKFLKA